MGIITLDFLTPGLNGSDGLIRGHFFAAKKRKDALYVIMRSWRNKGFVFSGKVKIEYIRYSNRLMDWDNAAASFKHIGDAMVMAGIIKDDNPAVVVEFIPRQFKVKKAEERTEIVITDLE